MDPCITTLENGRVKNRWSVTNVPIKHASRDLTDRHDRSRVLHCRRWRWANESDPRSNRRCGWRPKTCRAVPHILSTPGPDEARAGVGHRDADARRLGADRSEAKEERLER